MVGVLLPLEAGVQLAYGGPADFNMRCWAFRIMRPILAMACPIGLKVGAAGRQAFPAGLQPRRGMGLAREPKG